MRVRTMRRPAGKMTAVILLAACAFLFVLSVFFSYEKKPKESYAASGRTTAVETIELQQGAVSVNDGGLAELTALPGVGDVLGQAIIDERAANGPYFYPEDLLAVKGIGPSRLENIRTLLDMTQHQ